MICALQCVQVFMQFNLATGNHWHWHWQPRPVRALHLGVSIMSKCPGARDFCAKISPRDQPPRGPSPGPHRTHPPQAPHKTPGRPAIAGGGWGLSKPNTRKLFTEAGQLELRRVDAVSVCHYIASSPFAHLCQGWALPERRHDAVSPSRAAPDIKCCEVLSVGGKINTVRGRESRENGTLGL